MDIVLQKTRVNNNNDKQMKGWSSREPPPSYKKV